MSRQYLPLEQQIPPVAGASPSQMRVAPGEQVQWYLPGLKERTKLIGWRWIWFLPLLGMLIALALVPMQPMLLQFVIGWWKLMVFAVAVPVGLLAAAARNAIRNRKDPFCIHCGYGLTGLPDGHTCPECGSAFSFKIIEEYRRDPHWFIHRYKASQSLPPMQAPFNAGVIRKQSRDGT